MENMLVNPWIKAIDRRKINGKYMKVIIDDENRVINENPKKEDLKYLPRYLPTIREILKLQEDECKRYLIEFIRHWKRKNGRVPREKDFNNNRRYPSYITFIRIFETWNNAIREAGLQLHNRGGGLLCTDEELLEHLIKWYEDREEPPSKEDFLYNSKYPSFTPYNRFGGWQNSLKILGLDTDSIVRRGIIKTNQQKARLGEIFVNNCYKDIIGRIDLSGKYYKSPFDGTSREGNDDVKTSKLYADYNYWSFKILNINIDKIQWLYLLAFNEDYTKLLYAWKVPKDKLRIEVIVVVIGLRTTYEYNIENMKEYEITDEIRPIFEKWLENIKKQDNSKEALVREAKERLRKYIENKNKDMIKSNM